jgi:hypothetical protein
MWPASFRTLLLEKLLDWLWRSWSAFGVAGHGGAARPDVVIDPECLVLASSVWARYDPRLFDEILDWLCLHGSLINLQRLRNLQRTGLGDAGVLAGMSAVLLEHSGQVKWKALKPKSGHTGALRPLFLSLEESSAAWGAPEPLFAAQGFHRGRLELRQLSQHPSPRLAPNLWLKLRSLFGTTTRAEIMLQLLTAGPATAAKMAGSTSFTARAVLVTLREMALSGHVQEPPARPRVRPERGQPAPVRHRGPSAAYSLRVEDWAFLRTWTEPSGFPARQPVAPLLTICQRLFAFEGKPGTSADMQALQIRELLAGPLEQMQAQGQEGNLAALARQPGTEFLAILAERLPAAVAGW